MTQKDYIAIAGIIRNSGIDTLEAESLCERLSEHFASDNSLFDYQRFMKAAVPRYFNVFHRTWWVENPAYPNGLEPGAGEKHYIGRHLLEEDARELCKEWNAAHDPGHLSDKAEYEKE